MARGRIILAGQLARVELTEHHRDVAFRTLGLLEGLAASDVAGASEMLTTYRYTLEFLTTWQKVEPSA